MEIEPDTLRDLLDYDPETGVLTWRERPLEYFSSEREHKRWNTRYAGTCALNCLDTTGHKHGLIFRKTFSAHRVAWAIHYGGWPWLTIDHINGDPADNRIENLRDVSHKENCRNQTVPKNNASGVLGVYWKKTRMKWCANIRIDGKTKHLGSFTDKADAVAARAEADIKYRFHRNHGRATT